MGLPSTACLPLLSLHPSGLWDRAEVGSLMEEAKDADLANRVQSCLPPYTSELLVFMGFVLFF